MPARKKVNSFVYTRLKSNSLVQFSGTMSVEKSVDGHYGLHSVGGLLGMTVLPTC